MAKVLIVDDDFTTLMILRKLVEDMGHIVVLSPDGEHALINLMTNKDFDLLITDVQMPKLTGIELVNKLRNDATFKNLPTIIISSVVTYSDISDVIDSKTTYFVTKPLNMEYLKDYIQRSLQK